MGVIQNRTIEMEGFKWPLDTLNVATSNNAEFSRFLEEKEQAPIVDRCRLSYMAAQYQLQTPERTYRLCHWQPKQNNFLRRIPSH